MKFFLFYDYDETKIQVDAKLQRHDMRIWTTQHKNLAFDGCLKNETKGLRKQINIKNGES